MKILKIILFAVAFVVIWNIVSRGRNKGSKPSSTKSDDGPKYTTYTIGADGGVIKRQSDISPTAVQTFTSDDGKTSVRTTQNGIQTHIKNLAFLAKYYGNPNMQQIAYISGLNGSWFKVDDELFAAALKNATEMEYFYADDFQSEYIFLTQYAILAKAGDKADSGIKAEIATMGEKWGLEFKDIKEILSIIG